MNNEKINSSQLYGLLPTTADGIETLTELALDLQWSWNHAADALWQQINEDLWERTHNPLFINAILRVTRPQKVSQFAGR